jgi:Ser-tRNA(Ala) deacylase AlaX
MADGDAHGHTHRLELSDATVREWDATVIAADADIGIVLDRSAFYPGGGGQPPDHGVLPWVGFARASSGRGVVTSFTCCLPRAIRCLHPGRRCAAHWTTSGAPR